MTHRFPGRPGRSCRRRAGACPNCPGRRDRISCQPAGELVTVSRAGHAGHVSRMPWGVCNLQNVLRDNGGRECKPVAAHRKFAAPSLLRRSCGRRRLGVVGAIYKPFIDGRPGFWRLPPRPWPSPSMVPRLARPWPHCFRGVTKPLNWPPPSGRYRPSSWGRHPVPTTGRGNCSAVASAPVPRPSASAPFEAPRAYARNRS